MIPEMAMMPEGHSAKRL